ncbi:MAG TPA: hypothetical protein VGJ21_04560 [Terracidiphilus sp.]|jgi:hypothetical protein
MHFHFPFTVVTVLWTITLAAHLVLLVVLIGRERVARFPMFTAAIGLSALRLLMEKLLRNELPPITFAQIIIVTLVISAFVGLLVLLEVSRKTFTGIRREVWVPSALAVMIAGGVALWQWGPWPGWSAVKEWSPWQLLQLIAQRGSRLLDIETVLVGLLIVALGYRFGSTWRSHAQRIAIGLSTASIAQLGLEGTWENIVRGVQANPSFIKSMADQQRLLGLGAKMSNANEVIYIVALVWWILCLWQDEPGGVIVTSDGATISDVPAVAASTEETDSAQVLEDAILPGGDELRDSPAE